MWGLQTDKSVMTQQREMWPPEKHKGLESTGASNSVLNGQKDFQQGILAEALEQRSPTFRNSRTTGW